VNCTRCNAEAIVKRGSAAYCAKCALARDWEDVIAIVQEDRVDLDPSEPVALEGEKKAATAAPPAAPEAADAKEPAAVAVEVNGSGPADDLPADPFA
jgi:hypothetical protein